MEITAQSIDFAAFGCLRHRFLRALMGGALIALAIAMTFASVFYSYWFAFVYFLIAFIIVAPLQAFHRRPAGVCLFFVFGFLTMKAFEAVEDASYGASAFGEFLNVAPFLLAAYLCAELTMHGAWQSAINRDLFFAARGWRPTELALQQILFSQFGLPTFAAGFARKQGFTALRYILVALFDIVSLALGAAALAMAAYASTLWFEGYRTDFVGISLPFDIITVEGTYPYERGVMAQIFAAAALASGAAAAGIYLNARLRERKTEDTFARLYQRVRDWDTRAPIVFLRSFEQDNVRLSTRSIDPLMLFSLAVSRPKTVDNLMIESVAPYGPLVGIGDPRAPVPPLGAARIYGTTGDPNAWQLVVTDLCDAAQAIIACPATSAGIVWELELLKRTDPARVIYLANPEHGAEETVDLFIGLLPGATIVLPRGMKPIAMFKDPKTGWRLLVATKSSLQAYTVAINMALQALLGLEGTPLPRLKRKPKTA